MILRIWHGYTTPDNADAYEQLLKKEVFKQIVSRNVRGYKGIRLLKRPLSNEIEFVTIMTFTDYNAIKQFAGENYETAYVPDAAKKLLSHFDEKSQHYELIHDLGYE